MDKKVILSNSALVASAEAVASSSTKKKERTAQETNYDKVVASCVPKTSHVFTGTQLHHLYTVTTIASSPRYGGTRTPAICTSFERAVEIIESNEGDLWEHSYMLAVIEAVSPNRLYSGSEIGESYWYRWNLEEGRYEPIETPAAYENVFGFGIG